MGESFGYTSISGTLQEFKDIQSECASLKNGNRDVEVQLEAERERLKKQLKNQARKRYIVRLKLSSYALASFCIPLLRNSLCICKALCSLK